MIRSTLLVLTLLAQSCAMTRTIDDLDPFEPAAGFPHAAAVELVLAPGLAETVVRVELADTFVAHLGPTLVVDAEATIRAAFAQVSLPTPEEKRGAAGKHGTLTLRFVGSATDASLGAFSDATTTIDIEWTLEGRSGDLVWVGTIRGTGVAASGNAFNARSKAEKRFQLALDDVFAKSLETLRTAPEIRAWVAGGTR